MPGGLQIRHEARYIKAMCIHQASGRTFKEKRVAKCPVLTHIVRSLNEDKKCISFLQYNNEYIINE